MNKFIEKIVVPKSFLITRDCAPVGRDATATAMARLEKDMSGLLEDPVLEPTEKMKLYNQSMNRLLTYDRKQDPEPGDPFPDPVVPVEDPKEDLENDLTITLPPSLRSKGQYLYQKLKGTLQWNDKGEILTEDNQPISGSHITDLINTAIQTQRKIRTLPTGWDILIKSYKKLTFQRGYWGVVPSFNHKRRCGNPNQNPNQILNQNLNQNLNRNLNGNQRFQEKSTSGRVYKRESIP